MNATIHWPPSVNHYWSHGRNGVFIGDKGRAYRRHVALTCIGAERDPATYSKAIERPGKTLTETETPKCG